MNVYRTGHWRMKAMTKSHKQIWVAQTILLLYSWASSLAQKDFHDINHIYLCEVPFYASLILAASNTEKCLF